MKTYLILLSLLFPLLAFAQEPAPEPLPQGEVVVEQREEFAIPKRSKRNNDSKLDFSINNVFDAKFRRSAARADWNGGHWMGIGVHYSGLIQDLGSLEIPDAPYLSQSPRSVGVTLNPFDITLVHGRRVGLLTGFGFELNNFRFDQGVTLKREDGVTGPDYSYSGVKKSKLFTSYLNIPLLLEVQIGSKQKCFINGGVVGGINIGHHTKIKARSSEFDGTKKSHASLGMRNFHYGFVFNVGYDNVALTMTYYHSPLFRADQGPEVRQVNVGVSIML